MSPRALPILNALGCLALCALIVAQWVKELAHDDALACATVEAATARSQAAGEAQRRTALERDVAVLKESLAETQQSVAAAGTRVLVENARADTARNEELTAARDQITAWQAALAARDERIRTLAAELADARQRLDEAIAKLKLAGAR